jgi:two-component system, NtrC family, response regulator
VADIKRNILVVEDDDGLRRQYGWALKEFEVASAATREEAIARMQELLPDVAIVDLGLPPDPDGASEGLAVLEAANRISPETKVIIATGNEDRSHALRAISLGAYDFFQKPVDIEVLRIIIERAFRLHDVESENRRLASLPGRSPIDNIIANSAPMLRLLRMVEKVAPNDVTVMLLGESGTGKELLAEAIHRLSHRAQESLVAINCAAIPDTLIESELFGHEKGAFTGAVRQVAGKFELANKGTLFLDEIGDLPLGAQVKLLRFLQNRVIERIGGRQTITVDVRIICATHQDLEKLISEGRFREDLYYRLNEIKIAVPPLRDREGDTVLLAAHFMRKFNRAHGRNVRGFTPEALATIAKHAWRGNVRELENRVKRAIVMAEGPLVTGADLDFQVEEPAVASFDLRTARSRAEMEAVQLAMAKCGGNMSVAAKLLGVSRPTLYSLAKEHGLVIDS